MTLAPANNDLNFDSLLPLELSEARLQQFWDLAEVGGATQIVRAIALRYDGPTGGGAAAHRIQQLTLSVGATALDAQRLGASFAANLTAPLTTVIGGQAWNYAADSSQQAGPEPFGGSGGQFVFPLANPVTITIPAGGSLALDLLVKGNSNSVDPARLDFHLDPVNAQSPGGVLVRGFGCPTSSGGADAVLDSTGQYELGSAFSLFGSGYLPNAPVVTIMTAALLGQRVVIPGTAPMCAVWVDIQSGFGMSPVLANANGAIAANDPRTVVPVPKDPQLSGGVLYVQNVSPATPSSTNLLGISTSNYRSIVIGGAKAPAAAGWFVAHHTDSQAAVATIALYGGIPLQLR